MKTMVEILGQPEDHILDQGTHTLLYFSQNKESTKPAWRLKVWKLILMYLKQVGYCSSDLVETNFKYCIFSADLDRWGA